MKNLLNTPDIESLIARIAGLSPEQSRKWGTMTAGQVVPHMTDPLRVALGERQAGAIPSIFSAPVFSDFVVWVMPWPKGAPTAPEFIHGQKGTPPEGFERDKQALLLAIHRFREHAETTTFAANPVFGKLSNRAWGRLMWRHIDHHLRQFGC